MDWTGLLAWTIDQKNGEKFDTSIKPMDEQTKKWLLEALENCQVDEFKLMKELLEKIAKPEQEDSEEQRLDWFEQLQEILDALDRANDFCNIGGLALMFNYYQTTKFDSIKLQILKVITNSNQNNTFVQEYSGENNHLTLINELEKEKNIKIKELLIGALSSMIRGECLKNKRRFIDMNGIERVLAHLDSQRCLEKAINLIRDLLYYDEVLHQTYHDLSKFSNTTGQMSKKQNNYTLTADINDELKKNNELPENQKYKGIVKKILHDLQFTKLVKIYLSDTNYKNSDARIQYLNCTCELKQNQFDQDFKNFLQQHYNKLIKEQDKDEAEIIICKQFL